MTLDIAKARALCEAATPGPWFDVPSAPHYTSAVCRRTEEGRTRTVAQLTQEEKEQDAAFIAAARTLLPAALDEVERLRALCDRARLLADWSPDNAMTRAAIMDELDAVCESPE